jgi:uncharacterized delta-60 repeat protein
MRTTSSRPPALFIYLLLFISSTLYNFLKASGDTAWQAFIWFKKTLFWHSATLHLLVMSVVLRRIQGLNVSLMQATRFGPGQLARRSMHVPRERHCASPSKTNAGQLDRDFAHFGIAQVYFAGSVSSMTQGLALDPQGRVLVAAKIGTADGSRFGLARMLPDGSADLGFGAQGSVIGEFAPGFEAMGAKVQVLPDGRILLAGLHYENAHRTLPACARFTADGLPDPSFGDNGRQVVRLPGDLSVGSRDSWLPPGVPGAEACDFAVQDDGHILLIANHHFELADHAGMLIRLTPDGPSIPASMAVDS